MSISAALTAPSRFAAIVERATLWPWIVRAYCELADGRRELFGSVCMSHDEPESIAHVPASAVVLWTRAYCATMFEEMDEQTRRSHMGDYRSYLMFRKAHALRVEVTALRPWVDYDPITFDGAVDRWVATGVAR